jgi:hypothetical protein
MRIRSRWSTLPKVILWPGFMGAPWLDFWGD